MTTLKNIFSDNHLVKFVDVIGQQVDNLSCGGFGKCFAVETKSLCRTKALNQVQRNTGTWAEDDVYTRVSFPTNLSIDHVAHGHTDLHPSSLDVVEIQMMKNSQAESWQWDACSIDVGLIDRSCVSGVITLKVLDYLPKKHWLNNFEDFLMYKKERTAVRRTQCIKIMFLA